MLVLTLSGRELSLSCVMSLPPPVTTRRWSVEPVDLVVVQGSVSLTSVPSGLNRPGQVSVDSHGSDHVKENKRQPSKMCSAAAREVFVGKQDL